MWLRLVLGALFCLAMGGCGTYTQHRPNLDDFIGLYIPKDHHETGVKADSELAILPDGKCRLNDFPIVDYSTKKAVFDYRSGEAHWAFDGSTGNYQLSIQIQAEPPVLLRIHSNIGLMGGTIPYEVCQEGDDLDDDSLIFVRHPLGEKP